jgi:hypothetical protein
MKAVKDLVLGSNDAEDYRRRENKAMFNEIFIKDFNLDRLLQLNTFFLIGEKGTGKTAYAVFLTNNEYKNTRSQLRYIRETEYQKFVTLKREKQLFLSDYVIIWKVIILVIFASDIKADDIKSPFSKNAKLNAVKEAIDDYYVRAFSPEISTVMQIVDNTKLAAETILKIMNIKLEQAQEINFSETRFQTNIQYIYRNLLEALKEIKLEYNHFLFVDGIDIRPEGIPYDEYLLCVKGLANAVWSLNNDEFPLVNDTKGRFKVVLLTRPDIFASIGLQNSTNKIRNNSVYLDWRTTYTEYPGSQLFLLADRLLSYQQENNKELAIGTAFNYYFNWKSKSTSKEREYDTPFIEFLRLSYSRPRDIVTILNILQEIIVHRTIKTDKITKDIFDSNEFKNAFSEYLMGGIKDQLAFYYSNDDYELLLHFLSLFKGHSEFNFDFFVTSYHAFCDYVLEKAEELPEFIDSAEMFLQYLYDANIICYIDNTGNDMIFRWCYRERSISNISPKVEFGKTYRFHYGLLKALNLGGYY